MRSLYSLLVLARRRLQSTAVVSRKVRSAAARTSSPLPTTLAGASTAAVSSLVAPSSPLRAAVLGQGGLFRSTALLRKRHASSSNDAKQKKKREKRKKKKPQISQSIGEENDPVLRKLTHTNPNSDKGIKIKKPQSKKSSSATPQEPSLVFAALEAVTTNATGTQADGVGTEFNVDDTGGHLPTPAEQQQNEAQPPAVVAAVDTSTATVAATTDGDGNDDHLPTVAEQAALLDAFLGCGCVHPTDVQLTPAETAAVLAALKADPDVLAMAPKLHTRNKCTHPTPMCDIELRPLAAAIEKALRSVKPILQFTAPRQEAAVAAMKAIAMEAPEYNSTKTQQRMAGPLSKAVVEALRAVNPILKAPEWRQEEAVRSMAKIVMEATEFDIAAVAERMTAHFATWVPEHDLPALKQALLDGPYNTFVEDARTLFASDRWDPQEFIQEKMQRLMLATCPHLATDWRIKWKKGDNERILQQDGPDKCVALLQSLHAVTTEDVWRYCREGWSLHPDDRRREIVLLESAGIAGHFKPPMGDGLVDVAAMTVEGRALVAALDSGSVGIIAGEAGAGKSYTAAVVAARPDKTVSGLVMILSAPTVLHIIDDLQPPESYTAEVLERVVTNVQKNNNNVVNWVLYRLGLGETSRLKACGARVTVIIEEAGNLAACVQGLCVGRAAVRQRLMNVLRVRDVQLICVGTGVDKPTRACAAPPDAYHRMHVRPFLWPHLCEAIEDNEKTTPALRRMLEIIADVRQDHHRLVWLRALLENARYAAVFAKLLEDRSRNVAFDQTPNKRGEADENSLSVLRPVSGSSSPDDTALIAAINDVAQKALARFFHLDALSRNYTYHFSPSAEDHMALTLQIGLQQLLDRLRPPRYDSPVNVRWRFLCEREAVLTCRSHCVLAAPLGTFHNAADEPIAEVPLLLPVEETTATAHTDRAESSPHPIKVGIAPEPLLQVLRRGRAFLHMSAATAAMFLMLLQRDSPTDVSHPPAARALLLALTDYAAICASLAPLEGSVTQTDPVTAAARGVPPLRRIIDGLGVWEGVYGWGRYMPLATIHVAAEPIDHRTAAARRTVLLGAAFEAQAKTRPGDRHAVVIVNHPTAEHAPLLVVGPTQLVLLHAVTGRLAPDVVANVLRAVVPLCAVDGCGRPHYHQAKEQGAPVTDAALDDDDRCSAQRQRTTEALVEKARGVWLQTVAERRAAHNNKDPEKMTNKRCRSGDDDDGTADHDDSAAVEDDPCNDDGSREDPASAADDSSPVEELARMPAADTAAVDFTVDTVVVYEGAAAPEMALAADGRCEHPDVGGSELRVQYTRADDGTAFVVQYRYFVLDVTWRREGGRTGPLHDDEPLPPLYPVHQTVFAASE